MAEPRTPIARGPQLEATDARQSRPSPGAFAMLAVSTVVGLIAVAVIWAFFAGPLGHRVSRPQMTSSAETNSFHQGTPAASVMAPRDGESPAHGGTGQPQGGARSQP